MDKIKLVFATHNASKLHEVQALLPEAIELLSLDAINCHEEIPETEATIAGNARLKSDYVRQHYGMDVFADDTGLEVHALDGAPGVYSARYAGEPSNAKRNIEKLLSEMKNEKVREARFLTVVSLYFKGKQYFFEGICRGEITESPMGEDGFGYDPVFLPEGEQETFGQMPLKRKNEISHRALAIQKLVDFLRAQAV